MTVIIDNGKIQEITASSIQVGRDAQIIDAAGKYIVPGFLDMHAHVMEPDDNASNTFKLLLANGVIGVREMGGSEKVIKQARKLNADSAAGLVDAPEILMVHGGFFFMPPTAGDLGHWIKDMVHNGGFGSPFTSAAGVRFVDNKKAQGADFIKIAFGTREFVLAVLEEAQKQGLTVAGHLPPAISALEASNAGWHAMEHLGAGIGILIDCSTDETNVRESILTKGGKMSPLSILLPSKRARFIANPMRSKIETDTLFYQAILDTYSEDKCKALARAFVENDTWQVVTLIRIRTQDFSDSREYRTDPNLIYVPEDIRLLWEQMAQEWERTVSASDAETIRQFYALQKKVVKVLKEENVKMLAGSDFGLPGIWLVPGFSLHQEFRELASCGLSPLEVLQMTTLNGAEFLGRQATMGTVDEGKNADLVLLDANPIEDVANLDKISGVFLKGRYFSKDALEKMKREVSVAYK
jgi:hypothetical protein